MKRLFSVTLVVMILISSLSFAPNLFGVGMLVSASNEEYAPTSKSDMENKMNAFLLANLDARNATFTLTLKGSFISSYYNQLNFSMEPLFSLDSVHDYRYKPGNDYNAIAFFEDDNAISLNKQISIQNTTVIITLTYAVNWGETASQRANVENFAQSKVSELGVSSMSEYDKVKTLHDFLVNFASYDLSFANSYPFQMISSKTGTCQSYAGLFYMLCKKAGIDSRIIIKGSDEETSTGKSGDDIIPHAWNLVKINGNWYHVDPTWDDPISKDFNVLLWDYFLKSDSTMSADHFWDKSAYPAANSNYPTNLKDPVVTRIGQSVATTPKPKSAPKAGTTTPSNSPSPATTATSSSAQSTVSSEAAQTSEVSIPVVSSEAIVVTTQSTDFYSGVKEFFSGGMAKLYTKNKPLFIVIIIGIIGVILLVTGAFIIFFRRKKLHNNNMPSAFGGSSFYH